MITLVGDIGGTKTLLQLVEVKGDTTAQQLLGEACYPSQEFASFAPIVAHFLQTHTPYTSAIDAACFAVAGPVQRSEESDMAQLTNLPWQLDSRQLAQRLQISTVSLINDFAAVAYGLDTLPPTALVTLQTGQQQPQAPRVVLGAGTGLGACQMVWERGGYRVLPSEVGHTQFSPRNTLQCDYLRYLLHHYAEPCYDTVLSGLGITLLYQFLAQCCSSVDTAALLASPDPAAAITQAAAHNEPLAQQTLHHFCDIYGSLAGNLALFNLAYGGVYIAGGIAPKIIEPLQAGPFLEAFHAKGKMRTLMPQFPVHVVMDNHVGVRGAVAYAATQRR